MVARIIYNKGSYNECYSINTKNMVQNKYKIVIEFCINIIVYKEKALVFVSTFFNIKKLRNKEVSGINTKGQVLPRMIIYKENCCHCTAVFFT